MEEKIEAKWTSSFWRRIGALVIDSLLLGALGLVLGLAFGNVFIDMGQWGRVVGVSISLFYFGLLNSTLFNGQTIGKKILKLRVVNADNETISVPRSFVRYAIFALPFAFNGVGFSDQDAFQYLIYPISFIVFGGFFSIIYLYLFNRVTRQSLHDLVVGSYVVNVDTNAQKVGGVWKTHLIVVAFSFLVAAILPLFVSKATQTEDFERLFIAQKEVSKHPDVISTRVFYGSQSFQSTKEVKKTTTFVQIHVSLKSNIKESSLGDNGVGFASDLAKKGVRSFPRAKEADVIIVNLTQGYSIGISSKWKTHNYRFTPSDLEKMK